MHIPRYPHNPLNDLRSFFDQLFNLESCISFSEQLQQPPALSTFASESVELLQAHQQPLGFIHCDSPVLNDLSLQQNKTLLLRQLQVVRDRCMRLGKLASQLKLCQVGEEDRDGIWCGKCPLKEMDLSTLSIAGQG